MTTSGTIPVGVLSAVIFSLGAAGSVGASVPLDSGGSSVPEAIAIEAVPLDELTGPATDDGALMIYSEMAPGALDPTRSRLPSRRPIQTSMSSSSGTLIQTSPPPSRMAVDSGDGVGDVFITTNTPWFEANSGTGSFHPLRGAELAGDGEFDPALYLRNDDYIISGGTINVFAWNTDDVPDGLESVADILNPEYDGRIGLPEPTAPVNVEWYTWLEEIVGITLEDLAELNPQVFPGAVPLNENLV